jgi:hypothetical protein
MIWETILLEAIKKKSELRLKKEWGTAGYPRKPGTMPRVLRKLRQAGVRHSKEGEVSIIKKKAPKKAKRKWEID